MNRLRKEQGYALVTVLLVIIVFTIIFLSFMGLASSSMKQNQVIEKKSRSVAAAEMGISYYQVAIQKTFESQQQFVSDKIKENSSLIPKFKEEAAKIMADILNRTPIATPVNAPYYMKDFHVSSDMYKVNISFKVIGTDDKKETTLFVKMSIDFDSIINQASNEESNNSLLPTYDSINLTSGCKTLDCDNVYINGNGDFSGNNNIRDNQTIYTTGSLILDGNGNENNKTNVKIHADGAISIHKNMNSVANVIIETKDNATFMQNVKISGTSKILVNKSLTVNQNLELANNSFVYVGGTDVPINDNAAKIDDNLNILSSSKMCIKGNLSAKKITVDSTSKLIVFGKIWEGNKEIFNYKVNDMNTFTKECGTFIPPDFQIKWGDNVNTVINNVDYN